MSGAGACRDDLDRGFGSEEQPAPPTHTATPWSINEAIGNTTIIGYPESQIAVARTLNGVGQPAEANAAFIVRAVNGLDNLLKVKQQHNEQARAANFTACGCDYCLALTAGEGDGQG